MVGMVSLVGGLLLAGCGSGGDSPVAAQNSGVIDLSGVTQNWDKNLPSASRFTILAAFGGAAVRDKNTGLVWEQAPNTTLRDWASATSDCVQKAVGGTFGWRLPSVVELKSLQDPSLPAPYVPSSTFDNVQSVQFPSFWSATTNAVITTNAWVVQFWNNDVASGFKTGSRNVWCVRGPMNADAY
jgi:hypothetical protein